MKPLHCTSPLNEPIAEELMAKKGQVMARCMKDLYHRDHEEKNMLRGIK